MTLRAKIGITWPSLDLDVDLHVETGRRLVVMGPNGAGKSTVLRALTGLTPIHRGRIAFGDDVWDDPMTGEYTSTGRRNTGLVFQDHLLVRHLTALDNVGLGLRARGLRARDARREAMTCLHQLGLADLADLRPNELSGGQSQRVAIARALANRPPLLLLDEPLASLDVTTRRHMRDELRSILDERRPTTILVTHDPEDARCLGDVVAVVEDGRVVQSGHVAQLEANPATAYTAELFGGGR